MDYFANAFLVLLEADFVLVLNLGWVNSGMTGGAIVVGGCSRQEI